MRRLSIFAILLLPWLSSAGLHAAQAGDLQEVRAALMCTCPACTMVLVSCECGTADQMNAVISKMLDDGMSKTDVIGAYVARYGEVVLSAPTRKGFNLLAWIMPYVFLLGGFVLLMSIFKRWSSQKPVMGAVEKNPRVVNNALMARMEQEMKVFFVREGSCPTGISDAEIISGCMHLQMVPTKIGQDMDHLTDDSHTRR